MADGGKTLIELHTHGPLIGSRPRSTAASERQRGTEVDIEEGEDDGGRRLLPFLLVGALLVVAGVVARKKFSGDEEPETVPLAESDDISPTSESTAD